MVEKLKNFANSDIPTYAAGGGLVQLGIWAVVRLGIPTMFCLVTMYYITLKDEQIRSKDDLLQKNSEQVLKAYTDTAVAIERLNQSITNLNRNRPND